MVEMLQVQIKHPGTALTDKEQKLIECLVMRICVHQLYRRLSKPFRIRPAHVDSIHLLINLEIVVEDGLSRDDAEMIRKDLAFDIRQTLEMCEVATEDILLTAKA